MKTSLIQTEKGPEQRAVLSCRCCGAENLGAHIIHLPATALERWEEVEQRFKNSCNPILFLVGSMTMGFLAVAMGLVAYRWLYPTVDPWIFLFALGPLVPTLCIVQFCWNRRERLARDSRRRARTTILSDAGLEGLNPDQVSNRTDSDYILQDPNSWVILPLEEAA